MKNKIKDFSGFPPSSNSIAEILGISKSTISRALNNNPLISLKTRKKVQSIAKEIGYRPNAIARSLVTRRSGVVGLILGDPENPQGSEQLGLLLEMLEQNQVQLMLFRAPTGGDVASVVPILLQYQLDACILASITVSSNAMDILIRNKMPTVLVNRVPARRHGCAVLADNEEGGRKAAEFFLDRGATKCSFIAGVEEASTSIDREKGLRSGLAGRGMTLHSRANGFYTFEGGYQACRKLLSSDDPPDAIFLANDIMGLGAIEAARDAGISIPDRLQIIGFDGIKPGAWPSYSLTTIAISQENLARRVVQVVLELIKHPNRPPETILMSCSLIERKSTRKL